MKSRSLPFRMVLLGAFMLPAMPVAAGRISGLSSVVGGALAAPRCATSAQPTRSGRQLGDAPVTAVGDQPVPRQAPNFTKIVFGRYSSNPKEFEEFARRAKQSGATHIVLTAEDLPWARWHYDTPGDPYPAWIISNHGLLKVAVPEALKPYIPADYAGGIMQTLRERSQILGRLGLKGVYTTFEPQILPEKVYEDHPRWRGPQVDSPIRSRVPRFAPDVDAPDVLRLYRESVRKLVTECPQIDTLSFFTNDSGSGMSWSDGVYPGASGNTFTSGRRMDQRYRDFFAALRSGAADAGVGSFEVDVRWDRERSPALLAEKLEPGTAIANLEGPNATPYKSEVGSLLDYFYPFYPARGIPMPLSFVQQLESAGASSAPRLFVMIGDRFNAELYFSLYDAFVARPTKGYAAQLELLREVAAREVGKENAPRMLDAWLALHRVEQDMLLLNLGGTIFYLGSVQQRWLTRPFVPFPEELEAEEKDYYRRYQFQATTEERAADLHELQGSRPYNGKGGRLLGTRLLDRMLRDVESARRALRAIAGRMSKDRQGEPLLADRLRIFECLIRNCRNAIDYQYHLDLSKEWQVQRPFEVGGLKTIPEWIALRKSARAEIDNTNLLIELLESGRPDLIALAPSASETDIRILDADLTQSLRKKVKIMIRHWEDYERLFTTYGNEQRTRSGR